MKKLISSMILLWSLSAWASHRTICINAARSTGMGSSFVTQVCEKANKNTAACLFAAKSSDMSSAFAAVACADATPYTGSCVATGKSLGMGSSFTADVCQNANHETLSCIKNAKERGMGSSFVVDICRNNEIESSISTNYEVSSESDRLRIILIDTLTNIDENPERAKTNIQNILLEIELKD